MFRARTRNQVIADAVGHLASKSNITHVHPGSRARAIVEAIGLVVGNIGQDIAQGTIETLLSEATGATLDFIAQSFGLQRLPAAPARVEAADQNMKYYLAAGTFGDINNGNDITVPAGTQIRAESQDFTMYFVQREPVVLPAASSEVYFAADQTGVVSGPANRVGPNVLSRHNFTGYQDSAFDSLLVTNTKGLAGRPRESDDNLRFRIRNFMTSRAGANAIAVRLAALQVPGVSDVRILSGRAGIGTFDVVVFGTVPAVSDTVISEVTQAVKQVAAVGTTPIVVASRLVGISFSAELKFRDDTPTGEKNGIITAAREAARDYINDLQPGQEFVINRLLAAITSVSDKIVDIGTPNRPFSELLIWKQTAPASSRFSRRLETNYRVRVDEDLVPEPYITAPLNVTGA